LFLVTNCSGFLEPERIRRQVQQEWLSYLRLTSKSFMTITQDAMVTRVEPRLLNDRMLNRDLVIYVNGSTRYRRICLMDADFRYHVLSLLHSCRAEENPNTVSS
jgi:hypothetical protein